MVEPKSKQAILGKIGLQTPIPRDGEIRFQSIDLERVGAAEMQILLLAYFPEQSLDGEQIGAKMMAKLEDLLS